MIGLFRILILYLSHHSLSLSLSFSLSRILFFILSPSSLPFSSSASLCVVFLLSEQKKSGGNGPEYRLIEKINMRAKVELTDVEEDGGKWLVTGIVVGWMVPD